MVKIKKHFKNDRFCVKFYVAVQALIALVVVGVWYCFYWTYAALFAVWFIVNAISYVIGCDRSVMNDMDYDTGFPEYGVKRMFNVWKWYIPLAIVAGVLLYMGWVPVWLLIVFLVVSIGWVMFKV